MSQKAGGAERQLTHTQALTPMERAIRSDALPSDITGEIVQYLPPPVHHRALWQQRPIQALSLAILRGDVRDAVQLATHNVPPFGGALAIANALRGARSRGASVHVCSAREHRVLQALLALRTEERGWILGEWTLDPDISDDTDNFILDWETILPLQLRRGGGECLRTLLAARNDDGTLRIPRDTVQLFQISVDLGALAFARWLYYTFQDDFSPDTLNTALQKSAYHGHPELVAWLLDLTPATETALSSAIRGEKGMQPPVVVGGGNWAGALRLLLEARDQTGRFNIPHYPRAIADEARGDLWFLLADALDDTGAYRRLGFDDEVYFPLPPPAPRSSSASTSSTSSFSTTSSSSARSSRRSTER